MDLKTRIRDVPDFPKPGILFRDISPLLADPVAWKDCIEKLAHFVAPLKPDMLAGIESRGFLVAAVVIPTCRRGRAGRGRYRGPGQSHDEVPAVGLSCHLVSRSESSMPESVRSRTIGRYETS